MKNTLTHKKASLLSITLILCVSVLGPAIFVYMVDPFQIYHRSFFQNAKYSAEQRYQHAGWINQLLADPNENYQTIVIGSSVMANYTQTLINSHVAWGNSMNLSMNGSTPKVQHAIAKYALEKNPRIKHILWDVHFYYVFDPSPEFEKANGLNFPYPLYNNHIYDDQSYLFNETNIKTGLNFLKGDFSKFDAGVEDNGPFHKSLLAANSYNSYASQENREKKLLSQVLSLNLKMPGNDFYLDQKYSSVDTYMLDVLLPRCNTDTDINIMFSPTTRHFYASMADIYYIYKLIFMRRYVMEHTLSCKNIRVFAFDNVNWITTDLHNYADSYHYAINVSDYIIESIAKNENRLTPENIDQYEKQFIDNINSYKSTFIANLDKP